jgi:4-amino-4-deoxy-L-arabinose transferase-like glycosyltransferase
MYWDVASRWATGEPATLDLLWPPLYPQFMASVLRAGGSRVAIQIVQIALMAGAAALLFDVVRRLLDSRTAVITLALFVLDPQIAAFGMYFWPEALHLFLAFAALWIATCRPPTWPWSLALGIVLGLALLTKNLLGPFLALGAAVWLLTRRRRGMLRLGLVAAGLVLVVTPTIVENGRRTGAYVIGDSARFNVWVGLNDRERRNLINETVGTELDRYQASAPTHHERIRILEQRIRAFVDERGVWAVLRAQAGRQYFRLFDRDSFFTDQLPGSPIAEDGFGYRGLSAVQASWFRAWAFTIYAVVLLLAPYGVLVVWRRNRELALALIGYVTLTLMIFLLVHVKTRYRVQLMPALDTLAGAALASWVAGKRTVDTAGRWPGVVLAIAGACSVLVMFFAFGREWLD